jgi:hypothetical protein
MTAILVAGLLLCAAAPQPDGGHRSKDKPAGKRPVAGKRSPKSDARATAICKDSTFWRGELDQHACEDHGGVKEPL